MKIIREKAGVISEEPVWVVFYGGYYMVACKFLLLALWIVFTEWKSDNHIIG